jgi:hypothetical protein
VVCAMKEEKQFGIASRLMFAVFSAYFMHLVVLAVLGTFYEPSKLTEILQGTSSLPVFLPLLAVCVMYILFKNYFRK